MLDRRRFLAFSAVSLAFGGLRRAAGAAIELDDRLVTRPEPLPLALPPGFEQILFSRRGEEMDDGLLVPGQHDGMGAFPGPDGRVILVRNHEVVRSNGTKDGAFGRDLERLARIDRSLLYDAGREGQPELGGTTTLLFDPHTRTLERHVLSLGGTGFNCAGGVTPWNTWITCEEWTQKADKVSAVDHGWCFEVPADPARGLIAARKLPGLGRFRHEAVAVSPNGAVVYLTEDMPDGCFYRFLAEKPGELAGAGRLQALCAIDRPALDSRNWSAPEDAPPSSPVRTREPFALRWIDLDETDAPRDDLRLRAFAAGAVRFARCEGAWHGGDAVYFAATTGGPKQLGQVWKYTPSPYEGSTREGEAPPTLELFVESLDDALLKNCDNVTVAPWGDLFLCEDGKGPDGLVRVTPEGELRRFAMNVLDDSELAGVCFSPDGRWLFVNLQQRGVTVAITGPWESLHRGAAARS